MKTAPFYKLAPNRVWRTYLGGRNLDALKGKPLRRIRTSRRTGFFPRLWPAMSDERASGRESPRFCCKPEKRFLSPGFWMRFRTGFSEKNTGKNMENRPPSC